MENFKSIVSTLQYPLHHALQTDYIVYSNQFNKNINTEYIHEWIIAAENLNYSYRIIPCKVIDSNDCLHELLTNIAKGLHFPDYFGMNLDALYDSITDWILDCTQMGTVLILTDIYIYHNAALNRILNTLSDAAEYIQQVQEKKLSILI